jgi:hypothetical protein
MTDQIPATPSTTDLAIDRCEKIIQSHAKQARLLITLLLAVTYIFVGLIAYLIIFGKSEKLDAESKNIAVSSFERQLMKDSVSLGKYDSLLSKAILFQKLKNENLKGTDNIKEEKKLPELNDIVLYAIFVLVFAVLTSLYRFHLKEISRQEHYLVGLQRIRIAAVNSSTKYDGSVLTALTENAFSFDKGGERSSKVIKNPLEGHPTTDVATDLLNKLFEKFDFIQKK